MRTLMLTAAIVVAGIVIYAEPIVPETRATNPTIETAEVRP
jgi:hypothetical protein